MSDHIHPSDNKREMLITGDNVFQNIVIDKILDVKDCSCPLPLLKAKLVLNTLLKGQTLKVIATDKGSLRDFPSFCRISGNTLLLSGEFNDVCIHIIRKQLGA